jgi:uncharacterized protein YndB with AHSA1/START domain
MTGDERVLGSLQESDGHGVVRVEERLGSGIDEVWSALTETGRLAQWLGEFHGDLRVGGEYQSRMYSSGAEATGRVRECDPPRAFRVVTKGPQAANEQVIEVTLTAAGKETLIVVEQRGLPLKWLAAFGAGLQIHVEDLAAHLGGRERCDSDARMRELLPAYEAIGAGL